MKGRSGELRQIWFETVIVGSIALIATALCAVFHPQRPAWYRVVSEDEVLWSIDETRARELIAAGPVQWIDARITSQFEKAHFPGAISLDPDRWTDLMFSQQNVLEKAMGHPLIVYCDGNRCERSREVAQELRKVGFHPVYLFKGNWQGFDSQKIKSFD